MVLAVRRRPSPLALLVVLAAVQLLLGCAQGGGSAGIAALDTRPLHEPGPLRVLLTNDDGFESPGIRALRGALTEAGHVVTIVAPSENRSGAGSSITARGSLELVEHEPGIYSVSGTPADAVRVGLDIVFDGAPPDVVVSGANFGENIGPAVLVSGTVGAALTAMGEGVPAIAVSVGLNVQEARAEPVRFPSTIAAFPGAAELTVSILRALDGSRREGDPLLPPRTVLNVNYPARLPEMLAGVVQTNIGQASPFRFGFERAAGSQVAMSFEASDAKEPVENADTTRFEEGYVTVSVLDGNVLAGPALGAATWARTLPATRGVGGAAGAAAAVGE